MSMQRTYPRGAALVVEPPGAPHLDGQVNEVGEEVSTYALRRDETGALKVQVALMQGVLPEG